MNTTSKRLLFLADAPNELRPIGDSSLALAEEALASGYTVDWSTPSALELSERRVTVWPQWSLSGFVAELGTGPTDRVIHQPQWREASPLAPTPLENYAAVFVRKDPPFDRHYVDFCWLLALAFPEHNAKTTHRPSQDNPTGAMHGQCINSPHGLLTFHEKTLHFAALQAGVLGDNEVIPCAVTSSETALRAQLARWDQDQGKHGYVVKPWLGHGGRGIVLADSSQMALAAWRVQSQDGLCLVQPFDPEVLRSGDVRVLVAGSSIVGSFLRKPAPGRIESNLAQGGAPFVCDLSPQQLETCERLLPFLVSHGIYFAGIDMIGNRINEINITSPTGLRTLQILGDQSAPKRAFHAMMGPARD